jgi:hypothetical protein
MNNLKLTFAAASVALACTVSVRASAETLSLNADWRFTKAPKTIPLSQAKAIVFDKTGTLTKGVFDVTGVHHSPLDDAELMELAALAECASSHPISKSLQRAYGAPVDRTRVANVREVSGRGVIAEVDGRVVAVGNEKLMREMADVPEGKRTARFHSSVVLAYADGSSLVGEGDCEGRIGYDPVGTNGFGYDPLFLPDDTPGRTMAQLELAEKNTISHRYHALIDLSAKLTRG